MSTEFAASEQAAVLGRCLRIAVEGSYFPDWEFHTLMGLSRDVMRSVEEAWPEAPLDVPEGFESGAETQLVAVNNAANHLVGGYPHGVSKDALERDLGCSVGDVIRALAAWRGEVDIDPSGKGYFDRLM
jgi:hypothetical protein